MTEQYVFNIGLNRSGTTSLTKALNILNIPSIHYTSDGTVWHQNQTRQIEKLIQENLANNNKLLQGLDKKFMGFSDFNGEFYFTKLYKQYPHSKFILTSRPVEDWIRSVVHMERYQKPQSYSNSKLELLQLREKVKHYFNTKKRVKSFFEDKPGKLLEIDIPSGDGWEVLCTFLGKPIPNIPFPYLNQSEF